MSKRVMRAVRLVAIGQPLQLQEVPIPEVGPRDVLVRIARCGFNGGDPHVVTGDFQVPVLASRLKLPFTFGHDGVGLVAEAGPDVKRVKVGDRVFINPNLNCGYCRYCRTSRAHLCPTKVTRGWITFNEEFARYHDGFCSEYALAHESQVERLLEGVPFKAAGHLHILGIAHHALKRGQVGHGDVVVVNAATGCTGASAVLLARLFNPRKIVAVAREQRRLEHVRAADPEMIETISVTEEDLSQRLLEITDGEGADVLLDFVPRGVETTLAALLRMRPGGRVVLAGGCTEELCISYRYLMLGGLEISSFRGLLQYDIPGIMDFVQNGKLDLSPIDVIEFPLESANEAVRMVMERPGDRPFWVHVLPNPDLS